MADDIDIEEHDVLESLRLRQLEAAVKEEPMDMEESDPQYESDGFFPNQWEWDSHTTESPQIKVETPEDAEEFHFGKIILGSKPSQDRQVDKPDSTQNIKYNYNMSLVLEDWGPILEKSNCYCLDCGTLFATVNALDAHKMIAHSFLVATDKEASPERNKAVKSTARNDDKRVACELCDAQIVAWSGNLRRHYKNVHHIDQNDVESIKNKDWKICNHCNVYFPSDTALVKHLYALLPLNDNKDKTPIKEEKRAPVKVPSAVKIPVKVPVKTPVVIPSPVKPPVVPGVIKTPVKVPCAVKTNLNDNLKVTPVVKTYERKPVLVKVPSVPTIDVKSVKATNTTTVKDVTPVKTVKQTNSLILGSKVSNAKVDEDKDTLNRKKRRTCEICDIEYNFKYYMLHMKKFHKDYLASRLENSQAAPSKKRTPNTDRFKCILCNKVLTGKITAKQHRATKHPNVGKRKILVKLVNKLKTKVKTQANVVVKTEPVEDKTDIVVSKSTLFKCNRCSSHFLTCYGACAHSRVCETSSNLRLWSCPQCQRVFKSVDRKAHEYQHKISNAKFKVYVVYLEMVVRILCECPSCNVCFEEYKFWRHINFGCDGDVQSFHCEECKLPIDATSNTSHMSKHTQGDFTKEDFIKIDFVSLINEFGNAKVEVKTEAPRETPAPKKRKLPPLVTETKKLKTLHEVQSNDSLEFLLYYCGYCKCYLKTKSTYHIRGKCKASTLKHTGCTICCLTFTLKTYEPHRKLHSKYPNLTLLDLQFRRLSDDKRMKPHPEYYLCKSCHVNFTNLRNKMFHTCKATKSFTCPVCQRKIDKAAQKAHMRFHNYGVAKSKALSPAKTSNQSFKPKPSTSEGLPELLMKYQSLTTLWNILHLCMTCDTFTDSYDKVVEHCQNHVTNMESYGVVIMKCQLCNMKFDRECYRRHLELHSGGAGISRKSFKILKYDHSKLFAKNWLNYLDLPDGQKSQILNRSIYGEYITVKMKLVQQGPPEYTVYRCVQCDKCVEASFMTHHIALLNCLKSNKLGCSYCSLVFSTKQACETHESVHQSADLGKDSFRIVEFNDPNDAEFYKIVNSDSPLPTPAVATVPSLDIDFPEENIKEIKGQKFYMFYKCNGCGVCTHTKKHASSHVCSHFIKKICPKCSLVFVRRPAHDRLHEKYDFSENNVFTKGFNNHLQPVDNAITTSEPESSSKDTKKEATLYKCHCGLHYTSLKSIEKHYQFRNCGTVVREECSQCNLIFEANEIVNHLCNHHAQNLISKFHVITPVKKTLYKCSVCHVLFLNRITAASHLLKCDRSKGVKCKQCGLLFHPTVIAAHKKDHKFSGTKPDCYIVINVLKSQTSNNVLYKCKRCDVHFMQQKSLRNHVVKLGHVSSKIFECEICSLKFNKKALVVHKKYHHDLVKATNFKFKYFGTEDGKDDKEIVPKKSIPKQLCNNPSSKDKPQVDSFACNKCNLNFTDPSTLMTHNDDRCSKELTEICHLCDKKFSSRNIKDHLKAHKIDHKIDHKIAVESRNDPVVADILNECDKMMFRCTTCDLHFNILDAIGRHQRLNCVDKRPRSKCDECNITFIGLSINKHTSLHERFGLKKGDFNIVDIPGSNVSKAQDSASVDETQSLSSINETVEFLDSSFELDSTDTKTDKKEKEQSLTCHPSRNIKEHLKVHKMNAVESRNDGVVAGTLKESDKIMYRCMLCDLHFNVLSSLDKHQKLKCPNVRPRSKCDECNVTFTSLSITKHASLHEKFGLKKDDFNIVDIPGSNGSKAQSASVEETQSQSSINETAESLDSSFELDSTDKKEKAVKLYKCADCNVYFLTQRLCYKHTVKHTALEAKDFIECKLCGYQFTIMALQTHIKKHHAKEFNLEQVLVEEYQPNVLENNVPKIEIYYAIDKDQSRLVSTTTDLKNAKADSSQVANGVDENDSSEVTSNCCE